MSDILGIVLPRPSAANLQTSNSPQDGYFLSYDNNELVWVSITTGTTFKGVWDADSNTPTLASGIGTNGDLYIVNIEGNTNLDGITTWNIGDQALFDGSAWVRVPNPNIVVPVVELNSDTTLAQTDTNYLVTSSSEVTITIPQATTTNESRFFRIAKTGGVADTVVVPDTSVNFLGGETQIRLRDTGDSLTLLSSGDSTTGWVIIERSLENHLVQQLEVLGDSNNTTLENGNWLMDVVGDNLIFYRRESGVWAERSRMGSSITTDRYILEDNAGSLVFVDASDNTKTLLKSSIDGSGAVIGNPLGRVATIHNGELLSVDMDITSVIVLDFQTDDTLSETGTLFTYPFTTNQVEGVINFDISLNNVPAGTTARLSLTDSEGIIISQNVNSFDFSQGRGDVISNGINTVAFSENIVLDNNFIFNFVLETSNTVDLQGANVDVGDGRGTRFIPYLVIRYYAGVRSDITNDTNVVAQIESKTGDDRLSFRNLKQRNKSLTIHTANLNITSSNIDTYKDNALFFTNSTTNATITITDGIFDENDTLQFFHYPCSAGNGSVIIQAGITGTIDGQNIFTLVQNSSVEIKHLSGDDWYISTITKQPNTKGGGKLSNTPVVTTTIANDKYKIPMTLSNGSSFEILLDNTNNGIKYTGICDKTLFFIATIAASVDANAVECEWEIYNNSISAGVTMSSYFDKQDKSGSFALAGRVDVSQNDILYIYVSSDTAGAKVTHTVMNIEVFEV